MLNVDTEYEIEQLLADADIVKSDIAASTLKESATARLLHFSPGNHRVIHISRKPSDPQKIIDDPAIQWVDYFWTGSNPFQNVLKYIFTPMELLKRKEGCSVLDHDVCIEVEYFD